jgi:HEAT repeat protein
MSALAQLVLMLACGVTAQDGPPLARVAAELRALAQGGEVEAVARALQTEAEVAPALLLALGRTELALAGGETLVLGPLEREALAHAARALGRERFLPLWNEAASDADPDLRLGVVRVVGLVGRAGDLRLAANASRPPPEGSADARLGDSLEETVVQLLRNDRGTLPLLRPVILALPPELAGRLVRAVAAHDDPRALAFLVDALALAPRLELPLLCGIARAARRHGPPFDDGLAAALRPYLGHADRQIVRTALEAVGELQDPLALERLLEHAASSEKGLSAAAFQALRRVTLQTLPERVERWRAWYAAERRWEEERGPLLREALRGDDPAGLCAALRELGSHPLRRAQLAPIVAGLLTHPDEGVRLSACNTARTFGPELSSALLAEITRDPSPAVASAARAALGQPLERN